MKHIPTSKNPYQPMGFKNLRKKSVCADSYGNFSWLIIDILGQKILDTTFLIIIFLLCNWSIFLSIHFSLNEKNSAKIN